MSAEQDERSAAELWTALGRILPTNRTARVLDIGANEGQFITACATRFAIEALCVEPGSAAFRRLSQNIETISGVEAVELAVGQIAGENLFFEAESDVGSSFLRPVAGQRSSWAKTIGKTRVKTARLEDILVKWGPTVDLLKIDTQGTDLDVLLSAGHHLNPQDVRSVLVEVNLHPMYELQNTFSAILEHLDARGYFLAELFRYYNRLGWMWYADALFLPRSPEYAT